MGKKMFLKTYGGSDYYPVDLYNLLVYNVVGSVGSTSSTRNIRLRNGDDDSEQDFLFDGSNTGKTAITNWLSGAVGYVVTSTVLASFKTTSDLKVSGYFEERQTNARYISLMSDTLDSTPIALEYRLSSITTLNYSSQIPINTDKVITIINDTNVYSVYDDNTLIGSISKSTPFSGNVEFNLGFQSRTNSQFTGYGKGIIVHNGLLSASIILVLQTNIAI